MQHTAITFASERGLSRHERMDPRKIWRTKSGRTAALVAASALSAIVFVRGLDPAPITHLRERTFDVYQRIQPRPYGDFPVRIIDIDEASLASQGQWPWPRTLLAMTSSSRAALPARSPIPLTVHST